MIDDRRRAGKRQLRGSAVTGFSVPGVADLSPRAVWTFMKGQGASYWLLCFYFFLEYVRPQDIWTGLAIVPWGQLTLIACALALFLEKGRRVRFATPVTGLLAVFTVLVLLSSVLAFQPAHSIEGWTAYFNWILVFFLTINIVDSTEKLHVFMLFFLLWSFKMSQHATRSWAGAGFAFRDWGVVGIGGWFGDSGEFGIQMIIFFALSTYVLAAFWRRWGWIKRSLFGLMPLTAVIGIVGSSSRGALLGLAAVVVFMVLQKRRFKALLAAGAAATLILLLLPQEQIQRFEEAGEDRTSQARLTLWEDGFEIMNRHPVLGVGYDNWRPYYRHYYGRGLEPHNIYVEAGAELGYTGLVVFLILAAATFRLNWKTRRMVRRLSGRANFLLSMALALDAALVGYLVCGLFVTVLYYPFFWINLTLAACVYLIARTRIREQVREKTPEAGAAAWRARVGRARVAAR